MDMAHHARRRWTWLTGLAWVLLVGTSAPAADRPNILLILADDKD